MTVSHEIPVYSCTLANQSASSTSVAPSSEATCARLSPTRLPRMPPAPAGSAPPEKCSVASPQLVASAAMIPMMRSATVDRPCPGLPGTALESGPGAERDRDRKQERGPAEKHEERARRASAPSGPIRLLTWPGSPV